MNVSFITDPELKESITLSVMHQLPLWFSPPEDIDYKAKTHRNYPFFAVLDQGQPVAFAAVKIHNPYTADIYNIGVLEPYHHQGLGHQLVQAILDLRVGHFFNVGEIAINGHLANQDEHDGQNDK